jgi:hypothetical protein
LVVLESFGRELEVVVVAPALWMWDGESRAADWRMALSEVK